jgi:hypothetical protein
MLFRHKDESGISGRGIVAQGVEFDDGVCVMRWLSIAPPSTVIHDSYISVEKVHGHKGNTELIWLSDAFKRGIDDCMQDSAENAPFASVGGLDRRGDMVVPHFISSGDGPEYLRGYRHAAGAMYGDDWQTCTFGRAITIDPKEQP